MLSDERPNLQDRNPQSRMWEEVQPRFHILGRLGAFEREAIVLSSRVPPFAKTARVGTPGIGELHVSRVILSRGKSTDSVAVEGRPFQVCRRRRTLTVES